MRIVRRPWIASLFAVAITLTAIQYLPAADDPKNNEGFVSLFDGKSLDGWDGDPDLWRVEDGAIVGQVTAEKKPKGGANTFLIYTGNAAGGPEFSDFELRVTWKLEGNNSGIQYRSKKFPDARDNHWVVGGYQADMDGGNTYTGICYEERGRGIINPRGKKVTLEPGNPKPQIEAELTPDKEVLANVKKGDWNQYVVICKGNRCIQKLNGVVTADFTDDDPAKAAAKGILALQIHQGPPMKVSFKEIQIKKL
jgi:hypothetical protein